MTFQPTNCEICGTTENVGPEPALLTSPPGPYETIYVCIPCACWLFVIDAVVRERKSQASTRLTLSYD